MERSGVAAMALGIIEQCLELLASQYAKDRVQFGQPIGEFQLIQDKLARMEVARLNVQNLVFRTIEMSRGRAALMTLAEASAMKLYSARAATEVALEAVQLFGGNGYMSRVPGRAARPRRQGPADLRRHRRDPDHPHRQGPPPPLTYAVLDAIAAADGRAIAVERWPAALVDEGARRAGSAMRRERWDGRTDRRLHRVALGLPCSEAAEQLLDPETELMPARRPPARRVAARAPAVGRIKHVRVEVLCRRRPLIDVGVAEG